MERRIRLDGEAEFEAALNIGDCLDGREAQHIMRVLRRLARRPHKAAGAPAGIDKPLLAQPAERQTNDRPGHAERAREVMLAGQLFLGAVFASGDALGEVMVDPIRQRCAGATARGFASFGRRPRGVRRSQPRPPAGEWPSAMHPDRRSRPTL
jgi:hypothetical protein